MDLSTAKYIMDYLYFSRADEPTFQYYKNVSLYELNTTIFVNSSLVVIQNELIVLLILLLLLLSKLLSLLHRSNLVIL